MITLSCYLFVFCGFFSEVLKEAGKFSPQMLITEIEGVKHKHRTNRYCEELIKTFKSS